MHSTQNGVRAFSRAKEEQQLQRGGIIQMGNSSKIEQQTLSILSTFVYFRHFSLNLSATERSHTHTHTVSPSEHTLWLFDVILKLTYKYMHVHTHSRATCVVVTRTHRTMRCVQMNMLKGLGAIIKPYCSTLHTEFV